MKTLMAALALALALVFAPGTAHAARFWVSNELGDVAEADRATVAEPHPVQLIFQFQTNGAANARATNFLKAQITELVTDSGLFSAVSADPVEGGAIISVTINDTADMQAAERQGFATGLTFGLHGTAVGDFYIASVEYLGTTNAATIRKEARHTLMTTIGRTDPPANTTQVTNAEEGIRTVVRQLLAHMLNDLARDPGFSGAVAAAPAPAAETVAPAPTAEPAPAPTPAPTN